MLRTLLAVALMLSLVPDCFAKDPAPAPAPDAVSVAKQVKEVSKDLETALALLQGKEPTKKQVEAALELLQGAINALGGIEKQVKTWKQDDTNPRPACTPCAKCEPCPKCEPSGKQNCPPCPACERCDDGAKGKHKNKDKCGPCPPCGRCEPCDGEGGRGHKKGHHCKCDTPPEPVMPPPPVPMDAPAFQQLTDHINGEGFESGKLEVLGLAVKHAWFTVAQVKALLELYPFSSGKLSALRLVAPVIVDPQNSFTIFDSFPFDSDKKAAKEILGGN